MSTREHATEGNSFAKTATRAATLIDENLHWGADAVSNLAKQTAGHVERATDYVQQQGQKIKRQATQLTEKATEHPAYALLAAGAIGFTLGFLLRGSRIKT
jgi:ElaB/YqjD/DUF883 family membrane-anchored ribosome-binding protein